jgi:hypothetical protein
LSITATAETSTEEYSELLYLPEDGVGYFYSINTGNGDAAEGIGKAIRAYITRSLPKPPVPPEASPPPNAADYTGFYEPDSTRVEITRFLDRLAGITWVHLKDGKLTFTTLGGNEVFLPVADSAKFRYVPDKEPAAPVASLVLLPVNEEGRFLGIGMATRKRIATWIALLEILLTVFVVLSIASIVIYAPCWIIGGLSSKRRRPAERLVRLLPLLSILSFLAGAAGLIWDDGNGITRMGNLTLWSAAFYLGTILFALFAIASAIAVWRAQTIRATVRRFSITVTAALLIAAAYLAYWGIVGVRTWA